MRQLNGYERREAEVRCRCGIIGPLPAKLTFHGWKIAVLRPEEDMTGYCQTKSNQSQQGRMCCPLCRSEPAPLGKSDGTGAFENVPRAEASF